MNVTFRPRAALAAALWIATLAAHAQPAAAPKIDPERAIAVLTKHCAGCHNSKVAKGQLDIADRKKLVERKLVLLGNPDASELLLMVESGQMPPGSRPKPDEDERRLLRDWIKSRMPEPPPPPPKYGEEYLLKLIADDWNKAKKPTVRYVSLNHLLATEAGQKRLPKARAELTRILGALAGPRAPGLELKALDKDQSAFRLDLESIGWDARPFSTLVTKGEKKIPKPSTLLDLFDLVLLEYPYGVLALKNKNWPAVVPMLQATKPIRPLPYVRGDWLAAAVTDPVLGRELLTLLGKAEDAPVPAAPPKEVWPDTLDLDEFMVDLGWDGDKEGLGKAIAKVGPREAGGVRRAEWERYWPAVVRQLERGVPVFPLDQARREPYTSDHGFVLKGQTVDFKTKKPKNKFYGGDFMALEMEASRDVTVEATVFDREKDYLTPPYGPPQPVKGGKPFYEDYKDKEGPQGYEIDDKEAQEAWVVVAVSREGGKVKLDEGEALVTGKDREAFRSRLLHRNLYELDAGGTSLKEPFDRAARIFAPFETLGPKPKAPVKPKKK